MRKDKGLNGDIDRLPQLTWMMFLKFLADLDRRYEAEAALNGEQFVPTIEAPYRWSDWALTGGPTGSDLVAFLTSENAMSVSALVGPGMTAEVGPTRNSPGFL